MTTQTGPDGRLCWRPVPFHGECLHCMLQSLIEKEAGAVNPELLVNHTVFANRAPGDIRGAGA